MPVGVGSSMVFFDAATPQYQSASPVSQHRAAFLWFPHASRVPPYTPLAASLLVQTEQGFFAGRNHSLGRRVQ